VTYQWTIDLNTFNVIDVEGGNEDYIGHPTYLLVDVGHLAEGGKATRCRSAPNTDAKGTSIADVDYSVDTQFADLKGVQLKLWRLSYDGDALGWWQNADGVYSRGSQLETYLYDPIYGILVGHSFKGTTNGVEAIGDGSWTEDYSLDWQLEDTDLRFIAPVTLAAEPSTHVAVTVDGVKYEPDQLPIVFDWIIGSTHALEVSPTVEGAAGVRYVFVQWSDGSKDASRTLTAANEASLSAVFRTQYKLTTTSGFGDPQGSGWYDANTQATFSVTTPQTLEGYIGTLGGAYVFDHWSGDSTATTPSASITMDGPKAVTAEWRTDNTMPYTIIGAVVALIAIAIAALLVARRKSEARKSIAATRSPAERTIPLTAPSPPACCSNQVLHELRRFHLSG
jgi:uncharacterized repeat protein (TIGR02543 family)